jgi:hypothetical protein
MLAGSSMRRCMSAGLGRDGAVPGRRKPGSGCGRSRGVEALVFAAARSDRAYRTFLRSPITGTRVVFPGLATPVEMCEESELSELSLLLHGLLIVCFVSGRFIM